MDQADTCSGPGRDGAAPLVSARFTRGAGLRPGLEPGDLVVWIDPASRQPYGVVRLPPGSEPAAVGSLANGTGEGAGEGAGGDVYVFTLLDASSPGFQKGSCWLEVHRHSQGPHIGFRSAAAAGRFLQARRRAALAPGQPAGDGHPEAASVSQNGAGEEAPRPLAPARALSASSEASFLDGAEATSFAGAATTATPGGAAGMAAFARRLARSSRLVFFNDNLGVYEQWEVHPSAGPGQEVAGQRPCGWADAPLQQPWARAAVQLRSRQLPHVRLEVELVRVGALASPRRVPSPPRRLPAPPGADGGGDARTRLNTLEAVVLEQWFTFVDGEKLARQEVEEAVAQLLGEMQELREGTAGQMDSLRNEMAREVDRLLRRLARREGAQLLSC
ncbi:hypothetical protein MNEG_13563 [Monoraphidium neglectum]|uniref:Uncharacterized protein n=1 Tax=Monoraphidium neglectum TaxID=145388 RepID=A0A0D2KEU9_9CHLO|nr:hypothetical protein MNEG_13563 [Monoraphidium neglectum]KIY94398.1 hypothetical protein MNEG_13563 [Monoraphidium neglectum]|eukprot:XP_013893418.1 hypothetical protein MNEG_13563 [Monoraphidium neglectum]